MRSSTLFKRANGIWYILYYNDLGQRAWLSTGERQKPAALAKLAAFTEGRTQRVARDLSLSAFSGEFLDWAGSTFAAATIELYRRTLGQLRAIVGDLRLSEITPRHLDRFKAVRLDQVSASTVHIELRTLRAAFYTAVRWQMLTVNPLRQVSLPRLDQAEPVYLSLEEFRRLTGVISERWFVDLVQVAVLTGLRRGELIHLRWEHLDLERRVLTVQGTFGHRTKGGKIRTVPINDLAHLAILRRSMERTSDRVFAVNGRALTEDCVTRKFKEAVRRAGLRSELHFHSLRHTFATWLLQRGVPIYEVSRLLGHSSVTVTEIYSHMMPHELNGAVGKLDFLEEPEEGPTTADSAGGLPIP